MEFTVNTADLQSIASVFSTASSEVAHLRGVLAGGADGPESASVSGSAAAAANYTQTLDSWTRGLAQLVSSLETMSRKVSAAAVVYGETESGNTMQTTQ